MKKAQLTVRLSSKLTIVESASLNLLWCIVFGPRSVGEKAFRNTGDKLWYLIDWPSAEKMKAVLESRDWQDEEYADNRNTDEVKGSMALMEQRDWGSFEAVISSVFDKVTSVELN